MKTMPLMILIIVTICLLSCKGNEPVSAALNGDTKLEEGDAVPFLLYQNYPNPFNPSTTIYFRVSQTMHLTLRVYTEDWQEVATIFDKNIIVSSSTQPTAPPSYTVTFNARDLANGIYYYVLEGGGYTQIHAMRLMK